MIEITPKKLSEIEAAISSSFGDYINDKASDPVVIISKHVAESSLRGAISGGLHALQENGMKFNNDTAIEIGVVFMYMMSTGIRVGIALAEAEQLERMGA